jgi:predicted RNase H-like HicB family nuclease
MNYSVEIEQESDGRWLAEVPQLPGVMAYGSSAAEAIVRAEALALRTIAEQLERDEARPTDIPNGRVAAQRLGEKQSL